MSLAGRISLAEYGVVSIVDDDGKDLGNVLMVEILQTPDGLSKVELIGGGRQQTIKSLMILAERIRDYMKDDDSERAMDFRFSGTFESKRHMYEVVEWLGSMCEEDTGFGETVVEGFSRELLEEFIVEFEKIHGMQSLWSDSQISRIQDSIEAYGRVNREKTHNNKQYIYSTGFHRLQITRQEFFDALGSGLYTVFPTSVGESMDPLGFGEIYYERQGISYKVGDNIVGNYDLLASLMESKGKRLISINELIKIFPNLKKHFMT